MANMAQHMKEDSENPGKHCDYAEKNELEDIEDFDGFQNSSDVTREANKAYMDALKRLTRIWNDIVQFLVGEDCDKDLDEYDED